MSSNALSKLDICLKAIKEYAPAQVCDIRDAIFFDFLYDFGRFLTTEYHKHYSPATAAECLRTLRKFIRQAILRRLVANIDNVPEVIEKLQTEVWQCETPSPGKTVSAIKLNVEESVNTLIRQIDTWKTKRSIGNDNHQDRKEREEALSIRCTAIYLFCLLNYGVDIEDAIQISRPDDHEVALIEKYGLNLPVSISSQRLVAIYNENTPPGKYLFATLDNKKYKSDVQNAAGLISKRIAKQLSSRNLRLYTHQTVFIDWLNLAIEKGLDKASAEQLWRLRRGKTTGTEAMGALIKANGLCNSKSANLRENWYLLHVFAPAVKRERFIRHFMSSGIIGTEKEAAKRIYAPEEKIKEAGQNRSSILSRYIFFRATSAQAQFANIFSPYAYVIKGRERNTFAEIKEKEIEDLQIMFRDFPEAVELIDGKKWLETHNAEIVQGCKAIICSGKLTGKEATVVRIKGKDTDTPTFFLEYVEGIIKFQTNLPGIALEIVRDKQINQSQ